MKKLLLISYAFPPAVTGGTWRAFKFTKYLGHYDVAVDVLTTQIGNYKNEDFKLLEQLKGDISIYRVKTFISKKSTDHFRRTLNLGIGDDIRNIKVSLWKKIFIFFRNYLLIPDTAIIWCLLSLPKAIHIIFKKNYNAILVTSPPYSVLIFGYWLKKITRIKLIIDYRDPWTQWFATLTMYESTIRKKIGYWMEKKILLIADYVIATTPAMTEYLKKRITNTGKNKFYTIYNGIDPDDFADVKIIKFPQKTIVYAGLLNDSFYSPKNLFETFGEIKKDDKNNELKFNLIILGDMDPNSQRYIHKYNLENFIIKKGFVPHSEVIQYLLSADLLLLLLNPGITDYLTISTKLFEYLYTRKHILALIPERSAAGEILAKYSKSIIIHPNDKKSLREFLYNWIKSSTIENGYSFGDENLIKNFDRRYQAFQLSQIMKKIS